MSARAALDPGLAVGMNWEAAHRDSSHGLDCNGNGEAIEGDMAVAMKA